MTLHPLVRWIGGRCLRWFYREQCHIGLDNIPAGAVLLIGNHPNDIPDILLGYHSTDRPVRYVGTISGASSPITRATYRGLGVIPVTRVRDARKLRDQGVDGAAVNDEAFLEIARALTAGEIVGVYPEGGVHDEPTMAQFRAGVAKMALNCVDNGSNYDVSIVPLGVHYDAPRTPRSDVTVVVGAPFSVLDWLSEPRTSLDESDARQKTRRAIALRNRMRESLLQVTRNAPTWEAAEARDRLAALVGALSSFGNEPPLAAAARMQAMCLGLTNSREVELLSASVERAGGLATSPRDCARVLAAADVARVTPAWPSTEFVVLTAPLAVLGLAIHGPVWRYIWHHAKRTANDRAEQVARAFAPGLYWLVLWYVVLGIGIAVALHVTTHLAWLAIPVVMLLPRLGDLGMRWWDACQALRLRRCVRRWTESDRAAIREAAQQFRQDFVVPS